MSPNPIRRSGHIRRSGGVLAVLALATLSACGQKGDLYIPDWKERAETLEEQLAEERDRNDVLRQELTRYRYQLQERLEPRPETLDGARTAPAAEPPDVDGER
ncbi:MAG: LPS translocon maturation chaperone LptM [Gammaproteobacteria bacterium]